MNKILRKFGKALLATLILACGLSGITPAQSISCLVVSGTVPLASGQPICTTATVSGYDGTIAINASGQTVNGHGTPIILRGINFPMDSQIGDAGGSWMYD